MQNKVGTFVSAALPSLARPNAKLHYTARNHSRAKVSTAHNLNWPSPVTQQQQKQWRTS